MPRKSNPALDALRRNVSGKVASGEAESIVEIPAGELTAATSDELRAELADLNDRRADDARRTLDAS